MSLRVMKALLWKDFRVHRPVLLLGGVLFMLPYAGGLLGRALSRESGVGWIETLAAMSYVSLMLSLVTLVGLAGHAFAAEREDRSSEFLACLPTSRGLALSSKVVMTTSFILLIQLANLALSLAWLPRLPDTSNLDTLLGSGRMLAPTGALLFGAAWLASAGLRQSTLAAVCGLAAPVVVAAGIQGFHVALPPAPFAFGTVYQTACLVLGLAGFAGGCAVYLLRFEP